MWEIPKYILTLDILGIADLFSVKKMVSQLIAEYIGSVLSMLPQVFMLIDENPMLPIYNLQYYGKYYNNQDNRLQNPPRPTEFFYGMVQGVSYGTLIEIFGPVSGGFINPAVTVGMFVAGEIKLIKTLLYIYIEVMGAIHGVSVIYTMCIPSVELTRIMWYYQHEGVGASIRDFLKYLWFPYSKKMAPGNIMYLELFTTVFFISIAIAAHDLRRRGIGSSCGVCVGAMLTACCLSIRRMTGSMMNPAKSYAICRFYNTRDGDIFNMAYIYSGMLGGLIGGIIFGVVSLDESRTGRELTDFEKYMSIQVRDLPIRRKKQKSVPGVPGQPVRMQDNVEALKDDEESSSSSEDSNATAYGGGESRMTLKSMADSQMTMMGDSATTLGGDFEGSKSAATMGNSSMSTVSQNKAHSAPDVRGKRKVRIKSN